MSILTISPVWNCVGVRMMAVCPGNPGHVPITALCRHVPGTQGLSIVDIFRVANGRIVEHWDNLQAVPDRSVNGHDQFSTLSSPQTSGADPAASTRASELLVTAYFRTTTTRGLLGAGRLFVAPDLYQHDPAIANGSAASERHYADIFAAHPTASFTVARVIAQGDLVAVHSHFRKEASDLGQSVVDIYRVQHGKIVEH